MLTGPNFAAQETMLQSGKFNVIASGGVSRREQRAQLTSDVAWVVGTPGRVRDLATGDELHHHGEHAGSITALALSDDGALAATAATDRRVRVWSESCATPSS